MTVTPYCNHRFQSRRDLHQFLSFCKQASLKENRSKIVSLSQEIEPIDPLVVLHQISQPDQLNFYFEKQEFSQEISSETTGIAIAAVGAVAQLKIEGKTRFTAAKNFINTTLEHTQITGDSCLPLGGPHFFCSFSFFDHNSDQTADFPAATVFMPKWQIARHNNRSIVVANLAIHADSNLEQTIEDFWQTLESLRAIKHDLFKPVIDQRDFLKKRDVADTHHFQQAVRSVLESIHARELNKVVLAHAVDISSPLPFHLAYSLNNLRTLYPDCHIFLTSNGCGQYFIGASPERLISLRHRHLVTDALAGSAPRGQTAYEDAQLADRLLNNRKELHEHRVVRDFITRQLTQLGLTPQRSPLRLLQLSNIQHLQTPIYAAVPSDVHLLDIVARLHPTPAVAGVPRETACELICHHEAFERSLYAAPIGWVDYQGDGEFAVGIRSALIDHTHARLYAGAGIVAGSDPNRELAEVQLKLQALLAALV